MLGYELNELNNERINWYKEKFHSNFNLGSTVYIKLIYFKYNSDSEVNKFSFNEKDKSLAEYGTLIDIGIDEKDKNALNDFNLIPSNFLDIPFNENVPNKKNDYIIIKFTAKIDKRGNLKLNTIKTKEKRYSELLLNDYRDLFETSKNCKYKIKDSLIESLKQFLYEQFNKRNSEKLNFLKKGFSVILLPYKYYDNLKLIQDKFNELHKGDSNNLAPNDGKFISGDDLSFLINMNSNLEELTCTKPNLVSFSISPNKIGVKGLSFYFIFKNKSNGYYKPILQQKGLLNTLYKSYKELDDNKTFNLEDAIIVFVSKNQQKEEILLYTHIPEEVFHIINKIIDLKGGEINKAYLLEKIFIENLGTTKIINNYINAINDLLIINSEYFFDYSKKYFNQEISSMRGQIINYIKGNFTESSPKDFCNQADSYLSLKYNMYRYYKKGNNMSEPDLKIEKDTHDYMSKEENFAYKIGVLTGRYLNLLKQSKKLDNSTYDLISYDKYNYEKLKFVFKRICFSIGINKFENEGFKDKMINYTHEIDKDLIENKLMSNITNDKDFSLFFYFGVFENLDK